MKSKIPEATITRLGTYLGFLSEADREENVTISSGEIAEKIGVSPALVRKDLAYFGQFGTRGVGYDVSLLHRQILKILGLNVDWNMTLVGFGNPEIALWLGKDLKKHGFSITSIFDLDPEKIGVTVNEVEVQPINKLEETIRQNGIQIGMIAVPSEVAQDITDRLVKAGIRAIVNFAPILLHVPRYVELHNMNLALGLEVLTFNICERST